MKILVPDDYTHTVAGLAACARLAGHELLTSPQGLAELAERDELRDVEAVVLTRERSHLTRAILERMPNLRLVSQTGAVGEHIDKIACNDQGVALMQGIGSPHATAELTWLLILAATRQLVPAVQGLRQGQWQTVLGREVHGRTLGILGFGKIGQRVARFAQVFGLKVQVWGSEASRAKAVEQGFDAAASREAFFAGCDIITLHQRLVPQTRGNVTANDLARMKPDALLVNTARYDLIEAGALLPALNAGRPGQLALDVFDDEPLRDPNHPLLLHPRVLATPHLGYSALQSYEIYFASAFDNVLAFSEGDYAGVLNPEVLQR